jgi:hypothetical protein
MFWLDIFLSLRDALATKQSQGGYSKFIYPKEKYIWAQVRILRETDKAILIDNGMKIWIPKSRIYGIRLRNNIFEIYVKESTIG